MLVAGCGGDGGGGGGEEQAEEPPPARTVQEPLPIYETISDRMRRIADLAAGECANERQIRRAMAKPRADAEQLPFDDLKTPRLVRELLGETRDTLQSCRKQRELQEAADEANRLADELDPDREP